MIIVHSNLLAALQISATMDALPAWPKGKKLVHLDLKGAPPRIDYLHKVIALLTYLFLICMLNARGLSDMTVPSLQLIGLFSGLGADGILVEYEDMFPYEGELKVLQSTQHSPYRLGYTHPPYRLA